MSDQVSEVELSSGETLAFLGMWAGHLADMLGPAQHGFTGGQVRAAVQVAEDELRNIWDVMPEPPTIPVVARTVIYCVLELLWASAHSDERETR